MFKKRTRPAGVREKLETDENAPGPSEVNERDLVPSEEVEGEGEEDAGQSVDDLILLRKLRRSQQGINLERLNRGDTKRKGKHQEEYASEKYGLQSQRNKDDKDDVGNQNEMAKRLVRTNNFTKQTNVHDVDKHMMAYIDRELAKRRGRDQAEEKPDEAYDPQAELFRLTEKYKAEQDQIISEAEEGNVTNSLGMLTSIPEVDLGMENRLRNIEQTEKAKREMLEHRRQEQERLAKKKPEDEDYASARFFRPHQKIPSDVYAIDDARREQTGFIMAEKPTRREPRHEAATDEQVYERFKKRMKR